MSGATVIYPKAIADIRDPADPNYALAAAIAHVVKRGFREEIFHSIAQMHKRVTRRNAVLTSAQITTLEAAFTSDFAGLVYAEDNQHHRGMDLSEITVSDIQTYVAAGADWINWEGYMELTQAQYDTNVPNYVRDFERNIAPAGDPPNVQPVTWSNWGNYHTFFGSGAALRYYIPTVTSGTCELGSVINTLVTNGFTIKTKAEYAVIAAA